MPDMPTEKILAADPGTQPPGKLLGHSREGRPLEGYRIGRGPVVVSLIGGCHADEPVGPAMLRLLVRYLSGLHPADPLVDKLRWAIVPHVNPDGEVRNRTWSNDDLDVKDHLGEPDRAYDPVLYVRHVIRELPGDDVEFGFPRQPGDDQARPENLAVARFLTAAGPFHLHGSFHGMGFAPGPWFLIEPEWIERTVEMRHTLRQQVHAMGYPLFDVDRGGEKGFHRIDEGFCTRPDSGAMRDHFLARGEDEMAGKFRPSSMELVRELGGDPLTLVSEMPLFLVPEEPHDADGPVFRTGTEGRLRLLDRLRAIAAETGPAEARIEMARLGIRAMPVRDQMRLQLAFLQEAIRSVLAAAPSAPPRGPRQRR